VKIIHLYFDFAKTTSIFENTFRKALFVYLLMQTYLNTCINNELHND